MSASADRSFAELVLHAGSPSDAFISGLPTSPIRLEAARALGADGSPLTPVLLPPRVARLSSAE